MTEANLTTIEPLKGPLEGTTTVPGDKSISHRAVLFSAMAEGTSKLTGVLDSADVAASIRAVSMMGATVDLKKQSDGSLAGTVTGWGKQGPSQPNEPIDCANSGTTARLLMGVLAPWPIKVELTGDDSLRTRPMRRITAPLMKMGVRFSPAGQEHLPIVEEGNPNLKAIDYDSPMASAQLKTAILLAGIFADGKTTVTEPAISRNHTELMLPEFGVKTMASAFTASVTGPATMKCCELDVPGDPSSAAFLLCAAALKRGSDITVERVSLNAARTGFVRTLERMGADISVRHSGQEGKEHYGTIHLAYTPTLRGCEIPSQHIASLVDEIPVLSLVAAHARGLTVFKDVSELRVKETDRLKATIEGLTLLGIDAWEEGNDLYIEGNPDLQVPAGLVFPSHHDHRLAMTWSLVGLTGNVPVQIEDFGSVAVSYPSFLDDIRKLAS